MHLPQFHHELYVPHATSEHWSQYRDTCADSSMGSLSCPKDCPKDCLRACSSASAGRASKLGTRQLTSPLGAESVGLSVHVPEMVCLCGYSTLITTMYIIGIGGNSWFGPIDFGWVLIAE